ncbi:hypothetical protein [Sphingobium sp. MK2]|uniref:hypothetical protein n=1 Tax=Sphingobium sp. MK2 TaxID=3116540 RepID=UPI0032E35F75
MTNTTLSTRQSFLAAQALRALAASLQAENNKLKSVFGDRMPNNIKQETTSRDEEIEAYLVAAATLDFNETKAS